ncbi:MAG: hypothetical protein JW750_12375 [Anaerolineaceae bacterium]|nr:hypothetical protein [Anaerolineaceae bacterium]
MKFHRRNPYRFSALPLANLAAFLLIGTAITFLLSRRGWIAMFVPVMGAVLAGVLLLALLVVLALGAAHSRRAEQFFESGRPLLRWELSAEEHQPLKDSALAQSRGMWKLQLGCLTVLLAISGFLTGLMLGMDENFGQAVLSSLLGLLAGGAAGALIGGLVGFGNQLAARLTARASAPYQAALAPDEVYVDGQYFRGNGGERRVESARMDEEDEGVLLLTLRFPNRVRMGNEEIWRVIVPPRARDEVKALLPRLKRPA